MAKLCMSKMLPLFKIICTISCVISIFVLEMTTIAVAVTLEDDVVPFQCPLTPVLWNLKNKPPIYKTNMLRKRVGAASFARGKFIHIYGRILDNSCVPLIQATVEIWHADSKGHLRYNIPEQSNTLTDLDLYSNTNSFSVLSAKEEIIENDKVDQNFSGSGAVTTDNMGYYHFYTVMPGALAHDIPKIFFSINHRQVPMFETVMNFPKTARSNENASKKTSIRQGVDSERSKLLTAKLEDTSPTKTSEQDMEPDDIYRFDIVLDTRSRYRSY